jgi:hypothetical protein
MSIPAIILIAALVAPGPRLPACTPVQRETWPVVDTNTVVEGRVIIVHQSPDGARRCGEVQVSTRRPAAPARKARRG